MRPLPRLYVQTAELDARLRVLEEARAPRRSRALSKVEHDARIALRVTSREREAWTLAAHREGYLSLSDWIRDRLDGAARARAMHSSDHQAFNTPANVLDAIAPMGAIALDPCSNGGSIVPARVRWTVEHDGLAVAWAPQRLRGEIVFVNPPFDALEAWADRCILEAAAGCEIVLLSPARVDVRWWDRCLEAGAVAALWRGRLRFLGMGSAPFPAALTYFGPRQALWRRVMAPHVTGFTRRARIEEAAE